MPPSQILGLSDKVSIIFELLPLYIWDKMRQNFKEGSFGLFEITLSKHIFNFAIWKYEIWTVSVRILKSKLNDLNYSETDFYLFLFQVVQTWRKGTKQSLNGRKCFDNSRPKFTICWYLKKEIVSSTKLP